KSKVHTNYKMTGPVTVAFRRTETPSGTVQEQFLDAGRNPPDGVIIHYWLREPSDSLQLTILDADGNEVRSFGPKREKSSTSATSPSATSASTPSTSSTSSTSSNSLASEGSSTEAEVQQVTGAEEAGAAEEEAEEEAGPFAPNAAGMNRFVWDYRY